MALPIAVSVSAMLLLSSLSIQALALHANQRSHQARTAAHQRDRTASAAMEFLQHAQGTQACLLAWPSDLINGRPRPSARLRNQTSYAPDAWRRCPGSCNAGSPMTARAVGCPCVGQMVPSAIGGWRCRHDFH